MWGQVGNWHTGLTVQFSEDTFNILTYLNLPNKDKSLQVVMNADRYMYLRMRPSTGVGIRANVNKSHPGHRNKPACEYYAEHLLGPGLFDCFTADEFPRFALYELEFVFEEGFNRVQSKEPLPATHLLPWPEEKKSHYHKMTMAEVEHQVELRVQSSIRAGGHGYFDDCNVPKRVVHSMQVGVYKSIIDRIRACI